MKSLLMATILAGLTACSSSKDTVLMTVNLGVPVQPRASVNLSKSLMSLMSVTIGTDCYQDQISILAHNSITKELLASKKVMMRTNLTNSITYNGATTATQTSDVATVINHLINQSFLDEPLTISIPNNDSVEISLVGSFFQPTDGPISGGPASADGTCDQLGTTGLLAIHSSALFGHAAVSAAAKTAGTINLNIDVMHTNPAAPFYTLTANPSRYHDWVELSGKFATSGNTSISAGMSHTCAVINGGVQCWGYNNDGQLGNNSTIDLHVPTTIYPSGSSVKSIAAGGGGSGSYSCVISTSGVSCWGFGSNGQLGDGLSTSSTTPSGILVGTTGATAISAGASHTCVIISGGAKCWGQNTNGQIGDNTIVNKLTPTSVQNISGAAAITGVSDIAAGSGYTCAVVNGGAQCWGLGTSGQLGNGTATSSNLPVQVTGLTSGVQAIATGIDHSCAIVNGGVQCWGNNNKGQLGNNTTGNSNTPVQVAGLASGVQAIAAGGYVTCALVNGGVQCWGWNGYYQMANADSSAAGDALVPTTITGLTSGVKSITVGDYHNCAMLMDGSAQCWGWGNNGQLGNNNTAYSYIPVQAQALTAGSINNLARLKSVSYLDNTGNPIKIKVDVTGSPIDSPKYYVPKIFPLNLEFEYTGTDANGGCPSNATSCSALYHSTVYQGGDLKGADQNTTSTPPTPPRIFPTTAFQVTTY